MSYTECVWDRALRVLTRTDNLYAVRFAAGTGGEDDVNRRFIELYANHNKQEEDATKRKGRLGGRNAGDMKSGGSQTLNTPDVRGGSRRSSLSRTLPGGFQLATLTLNIPAEVPDRVMVRSVRQ